MGNFSAHFGGPERTWKHIPYKKRSPFSRSRLWDGKMPKNEDFWSPQNSQIGAKMAPKKVKKMKKTFFKTFLNENL